MSSISQHIIELLYEHDCVIVPGLGAFLAQRVAARYDAARGLMLPPRKEVLFNSQIRHSDGMLADKIARDEETSFDAANFHIEVFVAETLRQTSQGTAVLLPDFGALRLTGGVLTFEPSTSLNLLTDSYGFAPIGVTETKKHGLDIHIQAETLRKAAISTAAAVALLLVSSRTSNYDSVSYNTSEIYKGGYGSNSSNNDFSPSAVYEDVRKSTINSDAAAMAHDFFGLVVASFSVREEAENYVTKMAAKGFDNLEIIFNDGRQRVIAAKFATREDALAANKKLRQQPGFEKSWLLHVVQ